jgi:hypothetical protein
MGQVQVAPDEAVIYLGVLTEGKTAAEATASNARYTQAVIDAVAAQPNHGITTAGLGITPVMSYDTTTGVGRIVGFRASNTVEVRTKVAYAAGIYDAGIGAGANQSSVAFRVHDEAPHREAALQLAVDEALREAKVVAKAAGVELKDPESIQVEPGGRIFYRSEAIDAKIAATPILPEETTISAAVQIVFRIRD